MRKLLAILPILLYLLCASPARATFSNVQLSAGVCVCSTTSFTVPSTGSGNLLALMVTDSTGSAYYVTSVTSGGTWTVPTGCQQLVSGGFSQSCAYAPSSTSGVTSITLNFTSNASYSWRYWEVHSTLGTIALDPSGGLGVTGFITPGTTSATGVTLTLTGTNDYIMQGIAGYSAAPNAIASPYADFQAGNESNLDGYGDRLNTTSGTAPAWTMASSTDYAGTAMAFAESGGASGHCAACDLSL